MTDLKTVLSNCDAKRDHNYRLGADNFTITTAEYALLRGRALISEAVVARSENANAGGEAAQEPIDRGEAVNLASNIRGTDNIENVTRRGILSLVDGVLRMDEELRRLYGRSSSAAPSPAKDSGDSLYEAGALFGWNCGALGDRKKFEEAMACRAAARAAERGYVKHESCDRYRPGPSQDYCQRCGKTRASHSCISTQEER